MRRAAILAALAAALCAPAAAAEYDIPWFEANPAARAHWLRACGGDYRLARDPRCGNAAKAEQRAYARRLAHRSGLTGTTLPPAFQTPLVRDAIRVACAQPPAQRGLLGRYCGRP